MLSDKNRGKIIIEIVNENGKLNSKMQFRGIAKNAETAITTLLINFASLSLEKGKNPQVLIEKHFQGIMDMLNSGKKLGD